MHITKLRIIGKIHKLLTVLLLARSHSLMVVSVRLQRRSFSPVTVLDSPCNIERVQIMLQISHLYIFWLVVNLMDNQQRSDIKIWRRKNVAFTKMNMKYKENNKKAYNVFFYSYFKLWDWLIETVWINFQSDSPP